MVLAAAQTVLSRKKDDCTVIWNKVCSVQKPHEGLTLYTAVIETCISAPDLFSLTQYGLVLRFWASLEVLSRHVGVSYNFIRN